MGGFCKGFRDEGFRVVWANEKDPFAVQTYEYNFPETRLLPKPLEGLSVLADRLEVVDVMIGGFPCQPFSVAGGKSGFADPRGRVFFEIIRLIREFGRERPAILLLENVPYLLNHDGGRTFARMVREIQQAGYWFSPVANVARVNTRSHTEIPQNRDRLYLAALSWDHFDKNAFEFPAPRTANKPYREYLDLGQRADDWYYFSPDSKWHRMFAESMRSGNPDAVYHLRRHYVREIKNPMVPTLTANMGDGAHNVPVIRDSWGIRKLTPVECLRLQGFLDAEVRFPPGLSRTQQYKQIGNAVTLPLARLLATECRRQLDSMKRHQEGLSA